MNYYYYMYVVMIIVGPVIHLHSGMIQYLFFLSIKPTPSSPPKVTSFNHQLLYIWNIYILSYISPSLTFSAELKKRCSLAVHTKNKETRVSKLCKANQLNLIHEDNNENSNSFTKFVLGSNNNQNDDDNSLHCNNLGLTVYFKNKLNEIVNTVKHYPLVPGWVTKDITFTFFIISFLSTSFRLIILLYYSIRWFFKYYCKCK